VARTFDQHPTEIADLYGKRFTSAVETEEGRHLSEAKVKWLTGGDRRKGRRMREDFWEYEPTDKIWLLSNHQAGIRGMDPGMWTRVKRIPFEVYFFKPTDIVPPVIKSLPADTALEEKLLTELPGILNRFLTGCLDWQEHGLVEPEEVRQATR